MEFENKKNTITFKDIFQGVGDQKEKAKQALSESLKISKEEAEKRLEYTAKLDILNYYTDPFSKDVAVAIMALLKIPSSLHKL